LFFGGEVRTIPLEKWSKAIARWRKGLWPSS